MWIMFNDAFLSIVDQSEKGDCLIVRARRRGDIEAVFGADVAVQEVAGRDYQFRADIPRETVGSVVAARLTAIGYNGFKSSVRDPHLHNAYIDVWRSMETLQEIPAYANAPRPGFYKHPIR
jgi:hypothetical protein